MTNPCPHARSAAEFITSRAVMGVEKYGHTLADAGLSPAALVRHAREEAADLLVYLTALEAALSWQPIETAPRDGTEIDIWVVPPTRRNQGDYPIYAGACSQRIPNARPCYTHAWQDAYGRTVTGRRFYDDGDQCIDPDDISERAARATHWRPLPPGPKPEPERSGHYECLSDKPSGTWDDAFKPEPTAPAVTRDAVMRVITATGYSNCLPDGGSCLSEERCSCARTIDAIMALIGGAP